MTVASGDTISAGVGPVAGDDPDVTTEDCWTPTFADGPVSSPWR